MPIHDRTFNLLPFYRQKHYICTFSENCSPTLNVFKVLLTYNLTVTEHKMQWTQQNHIVTITENMTHHTYKQDNGYNKQQKLEMINTNSTEFLHSFQSAQL